MSKNKEENITFEQAIEELENIIKSSRKEMYH